MRVPVQMQSEDRLQESVLSFQYVDLKIDLRSLDLVAGAFAHWTILLAQM